MQRRDLGFGDDVQRLMLVSLTAPGKACRREVAEVPDGRLFAYIDGIVIRVNSPKPEKLWASAKAGPGYILQSKLDYVKLNALHR
eukprot:g7890.t1